MVLVVKNIPANAGNTRDMGSIPGSGRYSEIGNGNSFQYSCLKNIVDRVEKSQVFTFQLEWK